MFDFLSNAFSSIFSSLGRNAYLTEKNTHEILAQINDALLQADVPYEVVQSFMAHIKQEIAGKKLVSGMQPAEQLIKIVYDSLVDFLGKNPVDPAQFTIPSIIMMVGLQGSGKTTFTAKLGFYLTKIARVKGKERRILAASVDFYRPAAIEQLKIVSQKAGIDFYQATSNHPLQAAKEIYLYSQKNHYDYLLLDTAGRLHTDEFLLKEVQTIDETLKPRYKILVLDAMTGQESLKVAQNFKEYIDFQGAILTKTDSDTRSGAAFAFAYSLQKPLIFMGTGEKIEDLELFNPKRVAGRILGMGDLESLLEKAQEKIKKEEQDRLEQSFKQGTITLQDFASQLDMMGKMGSLSSVMKYLPGMNSFKISPEMMEKGEKEVKKFKAIINSMTSKERMFPKILDESRKRRIAKGAGVQVQDVKLLLERFEQSLQFVKIFKKTGSFKQFFK